MGLCYTRGGGGGGGGRGQASFRDAVMWVRDRPFLVSVNRDVPKNSLFCEP